MFRLVELLGGLSVATDLGAGAPEEESLKRCVVAIRLARAAGCSPDDVRDVMYTALLQHLGCTASAHEAAQLFGDDIAVVRTSLLTEPGGLAEVWRTWVPGVAGATGRGRARVLATTVLSARKIAAAPVATCEVARAASRRLGLPDSIQASLFHTVARWDGKGYPTSRGDAIPLSARIGHVASTAVLFALHAGDEAGTAEVRTRSGTHLDPELSELFVDHAAELLDGLDDIDAFEEVVAAEPDPVQRVDTAGLESVARTFGDLVDLKSPWLQGHSGGVADLAAAAAGELGLADEVDAVRLAGYVHDLGRVAVSSRIWDKPGPLSRSDRDQVRLHAYHSERILARVGALAHAAELAGQHHERCNGSGYHRGVTGSALSMSSRVLAAADAFRGLVEDRPHRPGMTPERAGEQLHADVRSGALDGDAVSAVRRAAGLKAARRTRPADLTERQVEVLRLVAAGESNREIAGRLGISSRTAEHHVQDIYLRIGASTRAAAALFAMEHGLI